MTNPFISVIIPVYKVELYLRKCVDSVLAQTYTNLEIILIDDGSPDNCGKICDEYAEKDKRIRTIHKENGGLSSARNAALDIMKGEYVVFVDSDDWVLPRYIENMYENLISYNADLSISGVFIYYEHNGKKVFPYKMRGKNGICFKEQSIDALMYQNEFLPSAWAKLYKSCLFNDIRFPIGKLFEDSSIMYKIFYKCNKISYSDDKNYCYVQRKGSITHKPSKKLANDVLHVLCEMLEWIKENVPACEKSTISRFVGLSLHIYSNLLADKSEYKDEIKHIEDKVKEYRRQVIFNKEVKLKIRLACVLSYLGFGVLRFAFGKFKGE